MESLMSNQQSPQHSEKSEEVQVIIDRMPTRYSKYIALLVGTFILMLLFLSFIIKYPDTVDGKISITSLHAPVRIVANNSGRIHLLEKDKNKLEKGQIIAYIESGVNFSHILKLDSLLKAYDINKVDEILIPTNPVLGDIGPSFNSFALAHTQYKRFLNSDLYTSIKNSLNKQVKSDTDIITNLNKEILLKQQVLILAQEQLQKDSILLSIQAITEQEYQKSHSSNLMLNEALINFHSTKLIRLSEINKKEAEIDKLNLEEFENKEKLYSELILQKNALVNALSIWKEKYAIYAPITGELQYLGFWRENSYVQSGEELFTIIPEQNKTIGEVLIPSFGSGKVKIGQLVNVKIDNYPYDEYGLIKGTVQSISRMTNKINTKDGPIDSYLVTISFPEGMKTNFGIELHLDFESKGTVEIITEPKRLLERLFDNLKSKTEK